MTDEAKALVERLEEWALTLLAACEGGDLGTDEPAALMYQARDRIEALEAALREVFEEWAGSEGFIPETAAEGYLLQLTKRMADIARAALAGDSHDQ